MFIAPIQASSRRSLQQAGERLRQHYQRYRSSAPFWDAYQQVQRELVAAYPEHQAELCNRLAVFAQRLGAVEKAQLLETAEFEH
ncbi:hypothetical protein ATCM_13780 [Stenotrophomonas sp. ATCM1_4]|jgi:hypothetical protein|uniref:Uncharacterized protein n=1 Tax=Stenotrophomonas capsici TaxID=3110230 RepID=A0ABU5V901_9GAMM|nr:MULTISPECIES: hypothetical protein [unclassified Stenotrophomonas]MBD9535538.1 hypothetical protein [Stenotrophomonas sp. STM01]MEA5669702.1 hypothetical protein [Stenotrophomonas sp. MH1]TDB28625.1 hypothetical protein ATCM_13780 [Stenotrophomonas sp. ATCM1_4]